MARGTPVSTEPVGAELGRCFLGTHAESTFLLGLGLQPQPGPQVSKIMSRHWNRHTVTEGADPWDWQDGEVYPWGCPGSQSWQSPLTSSSVGGEGNGNSSARMSNTGLGLKTPKTSTQLAPRELSTLSESSSVSPTESRAVGRDDHGPSQ